LLYTLVILLEFATGIVELGSDEMGIFSLTIRYLLGILSLAVTSRRLQDRGYSGWWQLSYLIIIGIFVIPLLCILPAKEDENKWGRNPLLDM
jgi:Predicted membrane protein